MCVRIMADIASCAPLAGGKVVMLDLVDLGHYHLPTSYSEELCKVISPYRRGR